MTYFEKISELDIPSIIIGIVVIIMALKFLIEAFEWVCSKFGIEFKKVREKKELLTKVEISTDKIKDLEKDQDEIAKTLTVIQQKLDELSSSVQNANELMSELKDSDYNQRQAMIETMHDRIEQKSNHYINVIKGIPSNELDGYLRMFNSYKLIGGNHGLELLVNYCVNNLPLLAPTNPVVKK